MSDGILTPGRFPFIKRGLADAMGTRWKIVGISQNWIKYAWRWLLWQLGFSWLEPKLLRMVFWRQGKGQMWSNKRGMSFPLTFTFKIVGWRLEGFNWILNYALDVWGD